MPLTDPELRAIERYERIMLIPAETRRWLFWLVLAVAVLVLLLGAAFLVLSFLVTGG